MASEDVFEYGDRTMFQLRTQSFEVDGDYGTIIGTLPVVENVAEPEAADPLARLEQKLDAALQAIAVLQQKVDSLDMTLAHALNK